MATLAQLRVQAKAAGIPASEIRSAETADQLQKVIDGHSGGSKPQKAAVAKKKAPTGAAKKKTTARKAASKLPVRATASKKAVSKSKPAEKKSATTGKAKRSTTAGSDAGRNTLGKINYSSTDGWNARAGSAPDRIVKALKKFKGDRTKVFDFLKGDVWDFVGKNFTNGEKRSKADALAMLTYRIARTDWEFAKRTGQHDPSQNRVEYGTGGTGNGTWKSASQRKAATRKASSKKTTARKTTARKAASKKRTARR